jgi:F-type H+-transporting ATPase subunit delta
MTSKTAAIRYARALFDVALHEKADLERIEQELAGITALFDREPALKKVMLNPAVPVPRKRAAMIDLTTAAQTSPMVAKLLALLAERDRLIILPDLAVAFRDRVNAHRKIVRAEITTAAPLAPAQTQGIQQRLAEVTGRVVNIDAKVDPQIIGGLVAKVGTTVYDASITRQLEKMRQRLVESM